MFHQTPCLICLHTKPSIGHKDNDGKTGLHNSKSLF